jgi:hypothetical protein
MKWLELVSALMILFSQLLARRKSAAKAPVTTRRGQTRRNRPVRRVYRRYRQVPRNKAGANKSAIYTLARQVKKMQNQRMGKIQSHSLCYTVSGTIPNGQAGQQHPCVMGVSVQRLSCPWSDLGHMVRRHLRSGNGVYLAARPTPRWC